MKMERTDNQAGFTLLEMVVVLAIAALVFAIGGLSLSALKGRMSPERLAQDVADLMNTAHLRAQHTQSVQSVTIDMQAKSLSLEGAALSVTVPPDYKLSVVAGREIVADPNLPVIVFLPDGTSSGGEITVTNPSEAKARVNVSWLTGLTRVGNAQR